ncbi:vomeronasal type-1 receptor 3-like [Perognathus longimembris pacificus]|uniref:vomeronasal type-1 receptor 3-like n=1 Tax=Perognathus longimembris pacificus TaxID=214514 RepID=UPI002018E86A|nr:vomeronasal type-1 receptor 3-like [Perognathus longimembris pacificus]
MDQDQDMHSGTAGPRLSENQALSTAVDMAVTCILLFQIVVGNMANVILFFHNVSPILLGSRPKPTQVIFCHLAIANVCLLSTGIPPIMVAFVTRCPLSALGCQVVYFIHHAAHVTVLCSTSVLSTYQAVTLIPVSTGRMMTIRRHVLGLTSHSCCTCWAYSALVSVFVPMKITGPQDKLNHTHPHDPWFCSSQGGILGYVFLLFVSNAIFIGIMCWACGSTILLLYRHQKRQQQIHTSSHRHRGSPETRAAYTVLLLVVTFVLFYVVDSAFTFYITVYMRFSLWVLNVSCILHVCFPTISPVLLLLRDPRMPTFRF